MATFLATKKRRAYQVLWTKLDEHLSQFIGDGVVLAISGGPDSRALLEGVAQWPKRVFGKFIVVSIDHNVRSEAKQEAKFISQRAQRLGFDAYDISLPKPQIRVGEKELRSQRYEYLWQMAKRYSCRVICTAHHRDDNAEGYFMSLMGVGGGELGAAMREVESINGMIICRPFLTLNKKELLLALSLDNHTDVVRDRLDEARYGERAYVRYDVFPELFKLAPQIKNRLSYFGKTQKEQAFVINKLAKSMVIWSDEGPKILLNSRTESAILVSALWHILKKLNHGGDLRSCAPVINNIAKEIELMHFPSAKDSVGLDPTLNGFNLNHLNVKHYHLPGVVVIKYPNEILVKRI